MSTCFKYFSILFQYFLQYFTCFIVCWPAAPKQITATFQYFAAPFVFNKTPNHGTRSRTWNEIRLRLYISFNASFKFKFKFKFSTNPNHGIRSRTWNEICLRLYISFNAPVKWPLREMNKICVLYLSPLYRTSLTGTGTCDHNHHHQNHGHNHHHQNNNNHGHIILQSHLLGQRLLVMPHICLSELLNVFATLDPGYS